ncbi:MarR family winged helix-turn-helix transcriptional regulator [Nonomuraea dietziae]|uniref:MarR family winged helix-turn-helix transcriptional regulator n=1 Tax=Nonomuraea dietziae TaxID=65515 RepID=UPI0034318A44
MSDPSSPANLREQALSLLASGGATSRADLVETLRVAPSTVSSVVRRLLEEGAILEEGTGRSTGGRRPRILRLRDAGGVLAMSELGARSAWPTAASASAPAAAAAAWRPSPAAPPWPAG